MTEATPARAAPAVRETGEHVVVSTNPFARWLLRFYWVPVLAYVAVALVRELATGASYSVFQWSFVPAQLVVLGVASRVLLTTTPRLLPRLVRERCITREDARAVGERLSRRLGGVGCEVFSVAAALAFVAFSAEDVLVAYMAGQVLWKGCAVGLTVHGLGASQKLRLRPFHADGCAGLAPVGELCFEVSAILVVSGAFLGFWLACGEWVDAGLAHDALFRAARPYLAGGLVAVTVGAALAFVLPLWSTHVAMRRRADELEARYGAIAGDLAEREERLIEHGAGMERAAFDLECERIQTLRGVVERGHSIPRWPIPTRTGVGFVAAQFPMGLGFVASAQQLASAAAGALGD
jgi:hypothetical protein